MNIVIVEDEKLVSKRIERQITNFFGDNLSKLKCFQTLDDADAYIHENCIDLLCLDLNLAGRDGFELLQNVLSSAFHTIVISAYAERAIEAFEFGVLDFVAKPFTQQRLCAALSRFNEQRAHHATKYISIKRLGKLELKPLNSVSYIKADNIYSEIHFEDENPTLHDKSLGKLEQILPETFMRVHKSYIVNMTHMQSLVREGKELMIVTKDEQTIPTSRRLHASIKEMFV
ncbi:MAG: LytTR family DNA-binding domain-containing protein [Aliiglaciecola sp.]